MTSSERTDRPRIVVGVDGSAQSRQALQWAARIADMLGATVEAVIAWEYPAAYGLGPVPADWDPADDIRKVLDETIAAAFGDQPPSALRRELREGGAARTLLETSQGAAMLVVGSRGHGGFVGLLLGSVSASVAEHASCPVLVVHGDQAVAP